MTNYQKRALKVIKKIRDKRRSAKTRTRQDHCMKVIIRIIQNNDLASYFNYAISRKLAGNKE